MVSHGPRNCSELAGKLRFAGQEKASGGLSHYAWVFRLWQKLYKDRMLSSRYGSRDMAGHPMQLSALGVCTTSSWSRRHATGLTRFQPSRDAVEVKPAHASSWAWGWKSSTALIMRETTTVAEMRVIAHTPGNSAFLQNTKGGLAK